MENSRQLTLKTQEYTWEEPAEYFQECHASACIRNDSGDVMAVYFAGTKEGAPDVGIWMSRRMNGAWEAPRRIKFEYGLPHWNPILHRDGDRIILYYKVGKSPIEWWTMVSETADFGENWTESVPVTAEGAGQDQIPQVATKNRILVTSDGRWLAGASVETSDYLWDCSVEISDDCGKTWKKHPIPFQHIIDKADGDPSADGLIQPALWQSGEQTFHCLMRSSRGYVYRSDSVDGGETWCEAYPISLPNNNSGISVAQTQDGSLVLAYNPVSDNWGLRSPLSGGFQR